MTWFWKEQAVIERDLGLSKVFLFQEQLNPFSHLQPSSAAFQPSAASCHKKKSSAHNSALKYAEANHANHANHIISFYEWIISLVHPFGIVFFCASPSEGFPKSRAPRHMLAAPATTRHFHRRGCGRTSLWGATISDENSWHKPLSLYPKVPPFSAEVGVLLNGWEGKKWQLPGTSTASVVCLEKAPARTDGRILRRLLPLSWAWNQVVVVDNAVFRGKCLLQSSDVIAKTMSVNEWSW